MKVRLKIIGLLLLQACALWPVFRWYLLRLNDGADEQAGIVALLTAIGIAAYRFKTKQAALPTSISIKTSVALSFFFTLVYAAISPFTPPLLHAIPAVLALACTISIFACGSPWNFPIWGLSLISLPLIPSANFYLGYPVRAISAKIVAFLLTLSGFGVNAEGTLLRWNEKLIFIDVPCSGIKMLWTSIFLTMTLIALEGLRGKYAYWAMSFASLVTFYCNITRSFLLFFIESGIFPKSEKLHQGVGLLICSISSVLIILFVRWASQYRTQQYKKMSSSFNNNSLSDSAKIKKSYSHEVLPSFALASSLFLMVAIFPFTIPTKQSTQTATAETTWPQTLNGEALTPVALSSSEEHFLNDFPGSIARFRTTSAQVILRQVISPTRKLHPSADCLRAAGYEIKPADAKLNSSGQIQSCVFAKNSQTQLLVCENISDSNGKTYSDVSSWYWSAISGNSQGPWMGVTTIEQVA